MKKIALIILLLFSLGANIWGFDGLKERITIKPVESLHFAGDEDLGSMD